MLGFIKKFVFDFIRTNIRRTPKSQVNDTSVPMPQPEKCEPLQPEAVPAAPGKPKAIFELEERVKAQKLNFRKPGARHEAAHVVVGDAIGEEMDWVNVDGKPGETHAKTCFNYSTEALQILEERWDGLTNQLKMTQKAIDLAVCFVAGHLIEAEKYKCETVSQRIQKLGDGVWGTLRKGNADVYWVAWLLSLIDKRDVKYVRQLEVKAKQYVDANRERLEAIESKLVEQGYIDGDEFKAIRGKS